MSVSPQHRRSLAHAVAAYSTSAASIFRKSRTTAAGFSLNSGAAIRRRTMSAAPEPLRYQCRQAAQYPMVQCWLQLQFQSRLGRDGANPDRQLAPLTTDTGAFAGVTSFNSKTSATSKSWAYTLVSSETCRPASFSVSSFRPAPSPAPGLDRDNQIGTGSTDLLLGAFHRGLLTGDNAWQYFTQIMWRRPFLYQSSRRPAGFLRRKSRCGANLLSRASRSMLPPASFTITCTTCSASIRSRRWRR